MSVAASVLPRGASSAVGLRLRPGMEFDEWCSLGRQLGKGASALNWALGDWMFYGEWEYGSQYEIASELTGLSRSHLMNLKWIAGRFDQSRRRETLSMAHHEVVAAKDLDEQDSWLDLAANENLNREQFRAKVADATTALVTASTTTPDSTVPIAVLPEPTPDRAPEPAPEAHEQLSLDLELAGLALRLNVERPGTGLIVVSDKVSKELTADWSPPVRVRLSETSPGMFLLEARTVG